MSAAILDRRSVLGLASAAALLSFSQAAGALGYPPKVGQGIEESLRPSCSLAQALAAMARDNPEARLRLILTGEQVRQAMQRFSEIIADEELSSLPIEGELRYLEGVSFLLNRPVDINTIGDYAVLMAEILEGADAVIGKALDSPAEVTDDEVIQLFIGFAAVNLLNAALLGFPAVPA